MSNSLPHSDSLVAIVAQMIQRKDREWLLLRTFYVVADCRSYRRAATRLGLHDATAIRKRIQVLEHRLGTSDPLILFNFDGTGRKLTEAGRFLLGLLQAEFA